MQPRSFPIRLFLNVMLLAFLMSCNKEKSIFEYQYYRKIPKIQGVTSDKLNHVFSMQLSVKYPVRNVQVLRYLSSLRGKIANDVRFLLSLKSTAYLSEAAHEADLKKEIKELINELLLQKDKDLDNRIVEVIFEEFDLYNYRD